MKADVNLATTLLLGSMFSSSCVAIFYTGYILKNISISDYYGLAVFAGLYPIVMMLVANLRERIKKHVLFINAAIAIVSSYFVIVGTSNFIIPDFKLDPLPLYAYYITLGSDFALFGIGVAEVSRRAREASLLNIGVGLALGSVITGIIEFVGVNGWLYTILLLNFIIPVALLVYFFLYPEGKSGETEMFRPQAREVVGKYSVNDTTKGLKLTCYTILACLGCTSMIGVNAMAIAESDIPNQSLIFWFLAAAGCGVAAFVSWSLLKKIHHMESTVEKERRSQSPWLILAIVQSILVLVISVLELYVIGFHLSLISWISGGLALGFNIGAFFSIIAVQHPPRSNYAYYMTLSYFLIVSMAVGNYLKTMVTDMIGFGSVASYAIYILAALVLMMTLLVLALVVTIVKKRNIPSQMEIPT